MFRPSPAPSLLLTARAPCGVCDLQGKTELKSKEAKMKAAMAGGNRGKRKKWSKGKTKEKLMNQVLFDPTTRERMESEVPKVRPWPSLQRLHTAHSSPLPSLCNAVQMKLITTAILSERLKINGSLARFAIAELMQKGLIKQVSYHKDIGIYTRATHSA